MLAHCQCKKHFVVGVKNAIKPKNAHHLGICLNLCHSIVHPYSI